MAIPSLAQALERTDEIEITVIGRRSGRKVTNPVWFVHEGHDLYLLPVHGSDTEWYKNLLARPTIELSADGIEVQATAKPITDPAEVRRVVDKFRAKYGAEAIRKYYEKLDVAVEVPLD
jgi:deazaflavin-dependent oxidoreductase (nitroreductase family)